MLDLPAQFALDPISLPREQMIAFAERFDPQPFHLDETAAAGTLLGGLAASAWYVCAKVSNALRAGLANRGLSAEVAGVDQIILFSPIRADDTLTGTVRVDPARSCACGGHGADVVVDVTRMAGDCVARMALNYVMDDGARIRPQDDAACSFREGRKARTHSRRRIDDIPFFESIEIGDEIDLGTYNFGLNEIDEFRALTGEDDARPGTMVPCVPPWHLTAAWMQCMVRHYVRTTVRYKTRTELFPRLGPAAGFKQLRWHRNVAIGETISFGGWAERKLIIPSQADWGLLVVGAQGIDACGDTVVSFYPQMLIERAHQLPLNLRKSATGSSAA